jgi:hypothetical protein
MELGFFCCPSVPEEMKRHMVHVQVYNPRKLFAGTDETCTTCGEGDVNPQTGKGQCEGKLLFSGMFPCGD